MKFFFLFLILGAAQAAEKTGHDGLLLDEKTGRYYFPCPFPSWTLDIKTLACDPPVARPKGDEWEWDEETKSWMDRKALSDLKAKRDGDRVAAKAACKVIFDKFVSDTDAPADIKKYVK